MSKVNLTQILATEAIFPEEITEETRAEIASDFEIDLQRVALLRHEQAPPNCNAYLLTVKPSQKTYRPGFYRFTFEITYGFLSYIEFEPSRTTEHTQTELLPMC